MSAPPSESVDLAAIRAAAELIAPHARRTPNVYSYTFSEGAGCEVWLKLENLQRTGSFKLRGALNKLLALPARVRRRGVLAVSSGNHGLAVAAAAAELGLSAAIVLPRTAEPGKIARLRAEPVEVLLHGTDCVESEAFGRRLALERGLAYVSPYNDLEVVAGQGTVGAELARQVQDLTVAYVAVGGGGLIGGTAAALRGAGVRARVIGAQPQHSNVMELSVAAGEILDVPSLATLSDGTAGGIEPGAVTFPLCRDLVDEFAAVSEREIADAIRLLAAEHRTIVEGAAAVAVAAFRKSARRWRGRTVAIVLCGRNIAWNRLQPILAGRGAAGT